MIVSRNLHNQSLKSLSSLLHFCSPNAVIPRDFGPKALSSNVGRHNNAREIEGLSFPRSTELGPCVSWVRRMSSAPPRGRSMRSKVERRMRMESGKTMREIRRAKKIQKKLMTENERLVYNLKRAKKKVSLLLQKLKKYELPDLPPPVHDPEILTTEQLQAFRKIGFRNKNYVPVGVRGVFGGVVQNMHMHWKFHETVQVCCDNFPKEKIKEMASMIARLSGGIVINVHNGKTIIMYRGRNYRQPKNLIPINTLTKRKALFKARFEQALESQKLNIKKIEQQLRRSGINPEDPAATASIQRVAASFFNAIDNREGSPYVFRQPDGLSSSPAIVSDINFEASEPSDEREQAELDQFIADIEDAAEREWAAEEAAEKEDLGRIRYWNRPEFDGRFRRSDGGGDEIRRPRIGQQRHGDDRNDDSDINDDDDDDHDDDSDADSVRNRGRFKRNAPPNSRKSSASVVEEESEAMSDIENAMWGSDDLNDRDYDSRSSRVSNHNYRAESESEEESYRPNRQSRRKASYESGSDDDPAGKSKVTTWQKQNKTGAEYDSGENCSESEDSGWRRMATSRGSAGSHDEDDDYENERYRAKRVSDVRSRRKNDETWDSDGVNDSDSE